MRQPPLASSAFDFVIVGGGLQGSLLALALLDQQPGASIALIERAARPGGNHTWSFHAGDVPERARALVEPLVAHRWPGYDVIFPNRERTVHEPYAAISSERLAAVVEARLRAAPRSALLTGTEVERVEESSVTLADGRALAGGLVVDARGPERAPLADAIGYQKFVGLEVDLAAPHGLSRPLLMDARVAQSDGLRFLYVLPFGERRLLLEDTYFSADPALDVPVLRARIHSYASGNGMEIARVIREETGVLPLPRTGPPLAHAGSPLVAGYAGAWFHPATAYSFPLALRLALHVAAAPAADRFGAAWRRFVAEHLAQFRFATLLNRMLFRAFLPEDRWNAFERFYRLPDDTIRRFYALETTRGDRLRILCGRPPRRMSIRAVARGAS